MTDNIVQFPKGDQVTQEDGPKGAYEPPLIRPADEALRAALGKYDDVIIIGVSLDAARLITTLSLDDAVYEISRAQHKLHQHIDMM